MEFKVFFEVAVQAGNPNDAALVAWRELAETERGPLARVKVLSEPGIRGFGTVVDIEEVMAKTDAEELAVG